VNTLKCGSGDHLYKCDQIAPRERQPQDCRHGGYAPLISLVLVALVAIVTVSSGRLAIRLRQHAQAEGQRVQQKWASYSLRKTILPRASEVFSIARNMRAKQSDAHLIDNINEIFTSRRVDLHIELAEQRYFVVLMNEQAKANVNMMCRQQNINGETLIRRLLLRWPELRNRLHLRPGLQMSLGGGIDSLGQVFGLLENPHKLLFGDQFLTSERIGSTVPLDEITLWGDGRLDWKNCSDEALSAVASTVLRSPTSVMTLVQSRRLQPQHASAQAVDSLSLPQDQAQSLKRVLTDGSRCYSIWIWSLRRSREADDIKRLDKVPMSGLFEWTIHYAENDRTEHFQW